jgi:hypothetical protein
MMISVNWGPSHRGILLTVAVMLLVASGFTTRAFAQSVSSKSDSGNIATQPSPSKKTGSELISLRLSSLDAVRTRIQANDTALKPSYAALIKRADKALTNPLRSVTDKSRAPIGGDKHDYMSMGPYWWPNPDTPNGLPYIRRDGVRNMEVTGDALDADRLVAMNNDARDLSLAYYFTNDIRYANRCAEVLRTWFLQPSTKMNPNMRFAQSIPGIVDGRGIGLIDGRNFWMSIDAALLVAPSGKLTALELQQLRAWFAEFAKWMSESEIGIEESVAYNNHGMFYDAQMATYWRFTEEHAKARRTVFNAVTLRLGSQINRSGDLPQELERTRPFHYTAFALQAAMQLALHGEAMDAGAGAETGLHTVTQWPATETRCLHRQIRCQLNFFNVSLDGRSLKKAIENLARVPVEPDKWTHRTSLEPKPPLSTAIAPLLMAQQIEPDPRVAKALAAISSSSAAASEDVAWLMWSAN